MVSKVLRRFGAYRGVPAAYVRSSYRARANGPIFDGVERYCSFVGYPRSGHSLVGFLLDAHPDVLLAHELDAYRFMRAGFGRDQLFQLILDRAEEVERGGRVQSGYRYDVPGQWQGRYRTLRVIGHKKGSQSTRQLDQNIDLVDQLRTTAGVPVRFLHITRDPLDNISSIAARAESLEQAIAGYFDLCEMNQRVLTALAPEEVITLRHEDLVADPRQILVRLCEFIGLEPEPTWLDAASAVVFDAPHRTRAGQPWSPELVESATSHMRRFDFLQSYAPSS
jgi:hypothetical protein